MGYLNTDALIRGQEDSRAAGGKRFVRGHALETNLREEETRDTQTSYFPSTAPSFLSLVSFPYSLVPLTEEAWGGRRNKT